MKHLILLLLIIIPLLSFATEEFKFNAVASKHYELTKNGFIKSKPHNDTWSIVFTNNRYYLVANTVNVPLNILQSDENTISLSQPVMFSGIRIFTFFRKTNKFTFQETAYSDFAKIRKSHGAQQEIISVSYGSYTIE